MVSEKMYELGTKKSTIRTIFEYGRKRALEVGEENIYDFSIGNPNVPAPDFVKQAIIDILNEMDPCAVHGYTVAPGNPEVREVLAKDINRRFGTNFAGKNLFITGGAAGAITITFKALSEAGDEFITFAPYFPEYKCFVESTGASLKVVPAKIDDFQIQFDKFEEMITAKTKAIIVNSPNNPSGVVYSEETIKKLAEVLNAKSKEYNHPIFLISDEPYREIAYGVEVPYLPKYYDNTIVGYSYSKSLSLPGERIGYLVIPDEADGSQEMITAAAIANRTIGSVNAPSLIQKVIAKCVDAEVDVAAYDKNRLALYNGLKDLGFECIKPEGAFYLFVKSPVADEKEFCEAGKKYNILMVPGSSFACPGYVRLAYCVSYDTIINALPQFAKLAKEFEIA